MSKLLKLCTKVLFYVSEDSQVPPERDPLAFFSQALPAYPQRRPATQHDLRLITPKPCRNAMRDLSSKTSVTDSESLLYLRRRAKQLTANMTARSRKGLSLLLLISCATPENPKLRAYDDMAKSFLNDKLYAECLSVMETALKEKPSRVSSRNIKAICLLEMGKTREAEPLMIDVCEETQTPECWNNLAALYQRTHQYPKCHHFAQKALAVNSYNSPENAHSNQALCYTGERKLTEALSSAELAKQKAPQSCTVRLVVIKILILRSAIDDALREVQSALALCPASADVHFWSAYTTFKNGQKNDAYRKYQYIIAQFKNGEIVEASKSNLELLQNRIPIPEPRL